MILLNTGSYSKIKMSDDGKALYYVGNDGKEIYKYETETEKISSVVGAGELKKITDCGYGDRTCDRRRA